MPPKEAVTRLANRDRIDRDLADAVHALADVPDELAHRAVHFTRWKFRVLLLLLIAPYPAPAQEADPELRQAASVTLKRAVTFYRDKVASHGGYVYYYTPDLKERWGEGAAAPETVFVEPPGTPTVGLAYLRAFEVTGEEFYLDAARDTAECLVAGQLESGGWAQVIHFGEAKQLGKYRKRKGGNWNASSLDDGQTQAALRFLIHVDRALKFKHADIHEAATFGLDALLKAQFANGAFPQVWTKPAEAKPVLKAKFPDRDWKTEGRVKNYWDYYTLNDGLAGTVADVLILAHQVYGDDKYPAALKKLGDFLILAQLPDPQPGWCQQYDYDMIPIGARKFEPAAITGWESQDAMDTLIKVARYTGEKKYLDPIPKALEYYRKLLLPDGKIARYYEFKTDKPLYMDANYQLTYDASAAPTHYGWKQPARFDAIDQAYRDAKNDTPSAKPKPRRGREAEVKRVIKELDAEGRWVSTYAGERLVGQPKFESGFRYLSSEIFGRNVELLCDYLAAR